LLTTVRDVFVLTSVAVTVAPGTVPPVESLMLPSSVPVTACAAAGRGAASITLAAMTSAIPARIEPSIFENIFPSSIKQNKPSHSRLPTADRRLTTALYSRNSRVEWHFGSVTITLLMVELEPER
jgi:hypothetical protein